MAMIYSNDATKMPMHKENFFNKLNKKKKGRLIKTQTLINEGKTDKSLTLATY